MKRRTVRIAAILTLAALGFLPKPAAALDRDKRTVVSTGLAGAGIGTLVGLIMVPLSRNGSALFQGTSVGLYLGLIAGIYHITHRDDPGNPLHASVTPEMAAAGRTDLTLNAEMRSIVEVSIPVYRF